MSLEYKPRLKVKYDEEVVPHLLSDLGISNPMRVPKLVKVVLNVGMGDAKDNSNWLKSAVEELSLISGQKPIVTRSKKAIEIINKVRTEIREQKTINHLTGEAFLSAG